MRRSAFLGYGEITWEKTSTTSAPPSTSKTDTVTLSLQAVTRLYQMPATGTTCPSASEAAAGDRGNTLNPWE